MQYSRLGPDVQTDGTGLFVDDDGQGYVITSLIGDGNSHFASIELLTEDFTASTHVLVAGPFPIPMVENSVVFKRNGEYYVALSSCCCACATGSGLAVFWAPPIRGPWKQQYPVPDINYFQSNVTICGDYRSDPFLGSLVWRAQWARVTLIPLANGSTCHLMVGRRRLSGPRAPPAAACPMMYGTNTKCVAPAYKLATDFDVSVRFHSGRSYTTHGPRRIV